jgi:formamidopyrimidine-DNA glycosylase
LAEALAELAGLRILRVLSVGKEIFVIFESRSQIGIEGEALRVHLGESGGYTICSKKITKYVDRHGGQKGDEPQPWGPKAVKAYNPENLPPETEIELSETYFNLWDSLGSRYQTCPLSYVSTVQSRLHRDVSFENFALNESTGLIRNSEMLIVDLLMKQDILPGVGNIIKNEGLFRSRIHPLRKACDLGIGEARDLLAAISEFSLSWFNNCRASLDGAHMGCSLPLCYGRSCCTACGGPIGLIKEGQRRRLTFFCGECQAPDQNVQSFLTRKRSTHRLILPMLLPRCKCGLLPQIQVFGRPGKDYGRLLAICPKRKHIYQPGCAGQHRRQLHNPKSTCAYFTWLDVKKSPLMASSDMECCCKQFPVFRRALGLRDIGSIFACCKTRSCKWRLWLEARCDQKSLDSTDVPSAPSARGKTAQPVSSSDPNRIHHGHESTDPAEPNSQTASGLCRRWVRSGNSLSPPSDLHATHDRDPKRTNSHRPNSSKPPPKPKHVSWSIGKIEAMGNPLDDSDEPLTSGDEEEVDGDPQSTRAHLQLLSLEESWQRLRDAKSPDTAPSFEKRWKRGCQ